jgi:hypothetical protein
VSVDSKGGGQVIIDTMFVSRRRAGREERYEDLDNLADLLNPAERRSLHLLLLRMTLSDQALW